MRRPPLPPTEHIFGQGIGRRILSGGLLMGIISLAVGYAYWRGGDPKWQTMIFCTLTFTQLGNVLAIRSRTDSLFRVGVMSNRPLLLAVALTVGAQLLVVYLPPLQAVFRTVHLPWKELVACLAASMAVFWWMELDKWLLRRATVLPG